mmetsp:Transcript_2464/g.8736  ORF Transcript_2464/g.8736 Transcript_2464/m.8736 type:complete len:206 (-) Transcript_2464:4983-5600(-)
MRICTMLSCSFQYTRHCFIQSKSAGSFTFFLMSSSDVSRWCMCTVMHVSRFLRSFFVISLLTVMTTISRSICSVFFMVFDMMVLSFLARARPPCMSAVHWYWMPNSDICAGWLKMNSSRLVSAMRSVATLAAVRTASCMPSTSAWSHTSMLPCACTGLSVMTFVAGSRLTNFTASPCCEYISSILFLSTLSNFTLVTESKRPAWK